MSKTTNLVGRVADSAADLIEKVSSPASRAGSAVERAGRMLEENVDPEVIALQMTKNSPNGKRYTVAKVLAYGDLYEDSKTKAPLTAKQARAIIKDQRAQRGADSEPMLA
ncbi:hypothetical protein [Xanthomonas hortorum]|uniref:Uncharacterized protein n=1 Tax=Xanthomonas hortorum pv. gardneri TaxID=2754056 RepID=A0A6V7DE44_9XANT|nr:hypothetical protein [Xanthomonas hortorum]APP80629.1 hypothetical protein BJD10_13760 [Xanthomonas hortorum pv. gardneri]MCC8498207.1 hypothetical protein [Xanthomonas hortorum pv. gardneri]MCC8509838.1 hypothetical protein [Xanthomonas hortorum pv. gardneri]MCC8513049.1 hypothetical protein [Xanthomonas hortorum pv. gardneri]MCC8518802.1 hypothetical protein [Xanthomonas hortorum pv. gardneri]